MARVGARRHNRHVRGAAVFGFVFSVSSLTFADAPRVLHRSMQFSESSENLVKMVCELVAIADLDGGTRLFDVSVDGKRCSTVAPETHEIPLSVQIESHEEGFREVIFETEVPADVSIAQMRTALANIVSELHTRAKPYKPPPVADDTYYAPLPPKKDAHTFSRGAGIALIAVGASATGVASVFGFITWVASIGAGLSCAFGSCNDSAVVSWGVATGVTAGVGLITLVTGIFVLENAPSRSAVSIQIGPTGGALRVAF